MANYAVEAMNTIRANASTFYQGVVPVATAGNISAVADPILNYQSVNNEFLNALVNRIALTIVHQRMFTNPLDRFKKGMIPLGNDVQEIFTNPAKGVGYDMTATTSVFERIPPDVKAAYHRVNSEMQFPVTISNDMLTKAFVSWDNMESLIANIVNSLYSGANIYEYETMRNMVGNCINSGYMATSYLGDTFSKDTSDDLVTMIKATSGRITFPSQDYNAYSLLNEDAPVTTWTPKDRQVLLIRTDVAAVVDVATLAAAFNMDKADFMGAQIEVDKFGDTEEASKTLAVLVDESWFQIYDKLRKMTEQYNARSLSWNYFWNVWQTFSYSPFVNAVAFIEGTATNV